MKVTDKRPGLEAEAENSYTIRWHAPFENWEPIGETRRFEDAENCSFEPSEAENQFVNGGVSFEYYAPDANILAYAFWEALAQIGGSGDAATAWGLGEAPASGVSGLLSSLIGYLGTAIEKYRPKPVPGWTTFRELWNAAKSQPEQSLRTPEAFEAGAWKCVAVQVWVPYDVTPYRTEAWGTNGYQGFTAAKSVARRAANRGTVAGDFEVFDVPRR